MLTVYAEINRSQFVCALISRKSICRSGIFNIFRIIIRRFIKPEINTVIQRQIAVQRNCYVCTAGKSNISFRQSVGVAVTFQMVRVAIKYYRNIGFKQKKILFIFTRFGYEKVISAIKEIRINTIFSTDMRCEFFTCASKNMRKHSTACRFAVTTGNGYHFFEITADFIQKLSAGNNNFAEVLSQTQPLIGIFYRVGINHQIIIFQTVVILPRTHNGAETFKFTRIFVLRRVIAGYLFTHRKQVFG